MKTKITPTYKCIAEAIFNSFVTFEEYKVVLKDFVPKELAIFFL